MWEHHTNEPCDTFSYEMYFWKDNQLCSEASKHGQNLNRFISMVFYTNLISRNIPAFNSSLQIFVVQQCSIFVIERTQSLANYIAFTKM